MALDLVYMGQIVQVQPAPTDRHTRKTGTLAALASLQDWPCNTNCLNPKGEPAYSCFLFAFISGPSSDG